MVPIFLWGEDVECKGEKVVVSVVVNKKGNGGFAAGR